MSFIRSFFSIVIIIIMLPYMLFLALSKPSLKKVLKDKGCTYPPKQLSYSEFKNLCDKGYKDNLIALLSKNKSYTLKEAKKRVDNFLLKEEKDDFIFDAITFNIDHIPDENLQRLINKGDANKSLEYVRATQTCSLVEAKAYLNKHAPNLLNHNQIFTDSPL